MIVLAPLLLAQATPTPGTDDVVVTGERLKRLRVVTKKDRRTGVVRCIVKRRSGDPALDDGMCAALLACDPKAHTEAEMVACMTPALNALIPTMEVKTGYARDG